MVLSYNFTLFLVLEEILKEQKKYKTNKEVTKLEVPLFMITIRNSVTRLIKVSFYRVRRVFDINFLHFALFNAKKKYCNID